jgi:N-acetylneuraminic acid mutarotase
MVFLLVCASPAAPVPEIIRYQSTLAVGGTNFHGAGYFKFALIDPSADRTYWSNDGTSEFGREPQNGLEVDVNQGLYEVFLGDTTLSNMVALPSAVFTNNSVYVRAWFSTGSTAYQAIEPDQIIPAVGYAMMSANVADGAVTTDKIAAGAVTAGKLAAGAVSGASIAPASINSSHLAANSAALNLQSSGGLVLSAQPNATNLTDAGLLRIGTVIAEQEKWSSNMGEYCLSPRSSPLAVWSGNEFIVWGGRTYANGSMDQSGGRYNAMTETWTPMSVRNAPPAGSSLVGSGAVWIGSDMLVLVNGDNGYRYAPLDDSWRRISSSNAPPNITGATLTWTGTELLVIGSTRPYRSYKPATDTWRAIASYPNSNAPSQRQYHSAVWTGSELIVWGGTAGSAKLRSGSRYHPITDSWQRINDIGAPTSRSAHTAVWTGSQMIVWGGQGSANQAETATGGIYDLQRDQWKAINTNGAPAGRQGHFACWTSSGMVIWGGYANSTQSGLRTRQAFNDGALYNLTTDTWTPISAAPTDPVAGFAAAWTGSAIMVWGGGYFDPRFNAAESPRIIEPYNNKGMVYKPVTDQWQPMAFAPGGRIGHSLVWTGHELIVWGGNLSGNPISNTTTGLAHTGARFDPIKGKWYPLSTRQTPTPRQKHQAIWTGSEMIVWGGEGRTNVESVSFAPINSFSFLNTGARYSPATDTWTPIPTNGAPEGRADFSMVWSGHEAIMFGGRMSTRVGANFPIIPLNTGACYDPVYDRWTSMTTANAPAPRYLHTAVWTGREMFAWGGLGVSNNITGSPNNNGGRYDPIRNAWRPISTVDAPSAYTNQTAVWTGQEVIVAGSPSASRQNGRYDLLADRWNALPTLNLGPAFRSQVTLWNGREVLVWGESGGNFAGGRFDPKDGTWQEMTKTGFPRGHINARAVWADDEMQLFGGMLTPLNLNSNLMRYSQTSKLYLYGKP